MGQRQTLSDIFRNILGSSNVYFQPPETAKMQYPCIVYNVNSADTRFADNIPYSRKKQYQVIVIDPDPDSKIPDKIAQLPMCVFNRHYTYDNLNHDVFNLYY